MVFVGIIEDDQRMAREIIDTLMGNGDWCLLFVCRTLKEYRSIPHTKKNKVQVIYMDAGQNNFERLWQIRYLKQINVRSHIIPLLERTIQDHFPLRMMQTGACGFVYKDSIAAELKITTEKILNGSSTGSAAHKNNGMRTALPRNASLTLREYEIIECVVKGHTNKKIGEMMNISPFTVNAHLRNIYAKFAVSSRTELISQIINDLV